MVYLPVCAEARGECQLSCFVTLHLILLNQGCSLNLDIKWWEKRLSDSLVSSLPTDSAEITDKCIAMLSFLHGFWESKLSSSLL